MKKPTTRAELLDLINGMAHRERFCFPLHAKSECCETLELYCADVEAQMTMSGNDPANVTISTVDIRGKWEKGKNSRISRLRRLINSTGGFNGDSTSLLDTILGLLNG